MDIKKFWKETFGGFVLKNVLIAIVIFVALVWLSLIGVDFYTHHGESEVIPDLRGQYVEEAEVTLAKQGLYPQVIDSVYVRDKKLGTIIDQIPPAKSTAPSAASQPSFDHSQCSKGLYIIKAHNKENIRKPLNLIRSANAPIIKPGVITANMH